MADVVSHNVRSRMMSGIRGRNTRPEMTVRRFLHARGHRYRLHVRALPGTPDLVFPSLRTVLFVHGCFWHRHPGCRYAYIPQDNRTFWLAKLASNVERDSRQAAELRAAGWQVMVVWECEARSVNALEAVERSLTSRASDHDTSSGRGNPSASIRSLSPSRRAD